MIDAEIEIFANIQAAVKAEYPNAFVTGEYVAAPSSFPAVSIVEIDNAVYRNSQTELSHEYYAAVTYEINVYSNRKSGKKSECKDIVNIIDNAFAALNFTRRMLEPVPNQNDASIYRMLGRYRAVISDDHKIYRR